MIIEALRSGSWLNARRLRAYPVIFAALYAVALLWWAIAGNSPLSTGSLPLGGDFINVYAASDLLLDGLPEGAYDIPLHNERQHALVEFRSESYFGWHYPPMALLFVAPLALLPFLAALALWQGATLAFYLGVLRATVRQGPVVLLALGFTGVIVNAGHGQNGFLTTALLGGACLMILRDRPWLAGLLIALMLYKPQFGVLIPVALAAGGHWRVILAASVAGLALIALSYALLGAETWRGFLDSAAFTREVVLEQGNTGWHKIQSVFSMVRMAGGGVEVAYAAQGVVLVALAALVFTVWRRREAPFAVKVAILAAASLLATPYVLDYDLTVLALVLAWAAHDGLERGFLPWEKSFLALIWLWPLLSRMAASSLGFQFSPLVLGVLLYMLWRRAGPLPVAVEPAHARPT
jgi:alpha-1,2-mannosyltransferase